MYTKSAIRIKKCIPKMKQDVAVSESMYFNWTKSAIKITIDSQNETEITLKNRS